MREREKRAAWIGFWAGMCLMLTFDCAEGFRPANWWALCIPWTCLIVRTLFYRPDQSEEKRAEAGQGRRQ